MKRKGGGVTRTSGGVSTRYRAIVRRHLEQLPQFRHLDADQRLTLLAVASVLPFKVNPYVVNELIDWDDIPHDPIYQLTFPQAGMLEPTDLAMMRDVISSGALEPEVRRCVRRIQDRMNPHPAGQLQLNVPSFEGRRLEGSQHKYRETVLFFPSQGQTCHAYCTYCFRWAQFVGARELRFASREAETLVGYLRSHREVSDVLFTGGDPMVMRASVLARYILPLLEPGLEHITSIRIGSKALAYWPHRFLTDPDTDELLWLLERVARSGKRLAFMAHFSHPRELSTTAVERAVRRLRATGAVIRCQAPVVRHVNASAEVWAEMLQREVALGAVPYYMFVARDTGPRQYFKVGLARAYDIFSKAYSRVSGLARTVRGPSMSATPGKVLVDGIAELGGERVFVLKFLQAREPDWVRRVFFARFDRSATWLDDLEPAFGEREFFYEPFLRGFESGVWRPSWRGGFDAEVEADLELVGQEEAG